MGSTVTSSVTTGTTTVASGAGSNGTPEIETSSLVATVAIGSNFTSDDEDLLLVLGADSTALGVDTFTNLAIGASIGGNGQSQQAFASIDANAIATSPDSQVVASAIAFAEFYGDADFFFSIGQTTTSFSQNANGSSAVEHTSLDLGAFELLDPMAEGVSLAPPDEIEGGAAVVQPASNGVGCGCADSPEIVYELDGNLAFFAIDAQASGDDSFVDVQVAAFTVEDHLSSITASVTLAVD